MRRVAYYLANIRVLSVESRGRESRQALWCEALGAVKVSRCSKSGQEGGLQNSRQDWKSQADQKVHPGVVQGWLVRNSERKNRDQRFLYHRACGVNAGACADSAAARLECVCKFSSRKRSVRTAECVRGGVKIQREVCTCQQPTDQLLRGCKGKKVDQNIFFLASS